MTTNKLKAAEKYEREALRHEQRAAKHAVGTTWHTSLTRLAAKKRALAKTLREEARSITD